MRRALLLGLVGVLVTTAAHGQSDERRASREREAARRSQAQIQKIEAEKAQLQQQLDELQQKKSDDLQKKANANVLLQRQLSEARKRDEALGKEIQESKDLVARTQTQVEEQKKRVAELNQQLAEALGEGKRLTGELKEANAQLGQQRQTIAEQTQALQDAGEKNLTLYRLNVDLLDRYNKKGVWDAMLQREPFTQVKDVRTQALLQEYRDKLDAQKIEKPEVTK